MKDYTFTFSKKERADRFASFLNKSGLSYLRDSDVSFMVFKILPETATILRNFMN
ncbi:MAG: hypothetical protein K2G70_01085 [Turicibacter sp.]|nr:hypothetical protein [Turicibacter sp.]